jgi:molecular chaperone DnaJ
MGKISVSRECRTCNGYGDMILDPCVVCKSNGRVIINEEIKIKIPKGIKDQQQIRLNMRGEVGNLGGSPGDLYIRITVKSDPVYKRIGDDLYTSITIPMTLAILGGEIKIESFDGEKDIKIPEGMQNKQVIKIENLGMFIMNKNNRGNLLVEVNIKTPTKLSGEERLLIEKFSKLRNEENYIKNSKKRFTENIKKKIKNEK